MEPNNLVVMIGNLSRSLFPVQSLLTGLAYLIGILFFMTAISKLRKIGDARATSSSHEKAFIPLAYFLGGVALVFLPSAISALSNTAFGIGNVLQYSSSTNPYNIVNAMGIVVQTAGLIWFVRGCVLLVTASEPGVKHGSKGLIFICAGILAMNFEMTMSVANTLLEKMSAITLGVKSATGY